MKKYFLCVAFVLLFFLAQTAVAAPPRGYLSAAEIKRLLDLFPDAVRFEDVRSQFGDPTSGTMWDFEEYATTIQFNRVGSTLTEMGIAVHFSSFSELDRHATSYIQQLNALMRRQATRYETSISIWEGSGGYLYGMGRRSVSGIPTLIFIRRHRDTF